MKQLSLDFGITAPVSLPQKGEKKRVRYEIPTYKKYYKFVHINPLTDELQYDSDEKHIFRISVLQRIYSAIYNFTGVNPFEREDVTLHGLNVWIEDGQAEVTGSELLSIKERLKIHIALLRLLQQGESLEKATELTICRFKNELQCKNRQSSHESIV